MVRLRSSFASVWIFILLSVAALAAPPPASAQDWVLINTPSTGSGVTTQGTAPPAASEPDHLYILNGEAGIAASPLPQTIKDDLLPPQEPGTISVSAEEEDFVYIVGQEIAEGIEASEMAGELTPEIEAIAEPLDEETISAASAEAAASLFGGSCASQEKVVNKVVNLNGKTWSKDFNLGNGFTGSYSLNGQLEGQVTAEIKFEIKRKKVIAWCVPYSAKFKTARAFGNATSNAGVTLTGTMNYQDTFGPYDIVKPELFSVVFYIGPIPVRVGFNLPVTAGLNLNATIVGQINYNGTHVATGSFDYTCTRDNCTGSSNFDNTGTNGNTQTITGSVDGRVKPTPYVDIGFRAYLYTESIAYAQVGVRPHLLGDLWGYTGNTCGDGDGNGNFETVRALTFDLDRRIDLTGQASVLGSSPWKKTLRTGSVAHMGFWDLLGSSALQPQLHGPATLFVDDPGAFKVKIRPCWPYTDKVTYQLNWGDGGAVQELEGAPGTELTPSHTWTAAGNKTLSATTARDAHGRTLNQSTTRTLEVKAITPLSVTVTPAPGSSTYGNPITLTATAAGGHTPTIQYTLGRRIVGTAAWIPSPLVWQAGNVLSWTPAPSDVGSWELAVGVKDRTTAADANGLGFAAYALAGTVQVVAPLALSCPPVVQRTVTYGSTFTWSGISSTGGTPGTLQYASSRQLTGNASNPWLPNPLVWQANTALSWTPTASDLGTWQFYALAKDVNTPANPSYSSTCNMGQIKVVSPLTVIITPSPATSVHGNTITWTATANGGTLESTKYAFFRRRAGATAWTPDVTTPFWQTSNVSNWTPGPADVGTWEIIVWVKDGNTPANANTYGFASYANAGPVQVVTPPLTLTATVNPAQVGYGNPVTWTATAGGGTPSTTQYAFFRRRSGTTPWTPDATAPVWQTSNTFTWTPTSADIGTWDTYVWVKDGNTPATMNTYGYAAGTNTGPVKVTTQPLTLTATVSPSSSYYGITLNWTATAGGGTPSTTKYALFRRRAGTSPWIPDVTAAAWQTSNVLSWTPALADMGTWEIVIWVKDGDTPATMNTYGYAAYYNAGPVQIVAPPTLSVTGSPAVVSSGTPITWTASSTSSSPSTVRYAFFRRRSGATAWIPAVTSPSWQTSNTFTWTPSSADAGTWDTYVWVKDGLTPPTMNTYGYAAGYNTGGVRVVTPLSGLSCSVNPPFGSTGSTFLWTVSASGGDSATLQYALFRRRSGTTSWTPATSAPAWQSGSTLSWATTSSDAGAWEVIIWAKDATSSGSVTCNPGTIQVLTPMTVTGTGSPASSPYGATITWTATASGGDPATTKYAFFRRLAGTTPWTPDVTAPNWQTSRTMSWTPTSADVGTWEIFIWVKDAYTPPTMNTYGHAAYYNAGPVQVTTPAPLTVTGTGSPSTSPAGTTITWTATTSGGIPSTVQYALFRRRAGASSWTPDVTAPSWQSSRTLSWTPSAADVGTWEIIIWVKDINTSPTQGTYGFAAYYNAQPVQVY